MLEGGRVVKLAGGMDHGLPCAAVELAGGLVDVRRAKRVGHLIDADAARGQCIGIDLHAHGAFLRAIDVDLCHAVERGQSSRHQRFRILIHLRQQQGRRNHGDVNDGAVGRIDLPQRGRRGQVGRQQPRSRRNRRLHVLCCAIDVAAQFELQRNAGRVLRAGTRSSSLSRRWSRTGFPAASPRPPPWCRDRRRAGCADTLMVGKSTLGSSLTGMVA